MTLILENMKVTLNLDEEGDIELDDGQVSVRGW